MRTNLATLLVTVLLLACSGGLVVHGQQPKNAPPIWLDFDMENIPEPKEMETGYLYDFANGTLFQQAKQGADISRTFRYVFRVPKESENVNSVDEVPDSSWFTNRNGGKPMSLADIRRGPDVTDGPAPGALTVIRGKTTGITPGFFVRDGRGDVYVIKFDPPDFPELATGAEVISTKLFYAIGYNVPQNTIFRFRREQLTVAPDAKYQDKSGQKRPMTEADIDSLLAQAARMADGGYRCVASKLLTGKPKGGFSFVGMRADDPNDIIRHEHRRDVRGLRVFSAWLAHNDIRVGNTLDMYVTEEGRSFLRHYLIDLGSTLGSDTVFPNVPIVGHEYQLDGFEGMRQLFTLGFYPRPWLKETYEPLVSPAIGRFSAAHFSPRKWKQNFPLVAFENMTEKDARWAARIVNSFTDEQLRAVVELAEYSNPKDAEYMTKTLIARRDLIVQTYLKGNQPTARARSVASPKQP